MIHNLRNKDCGKLMGLCECTSSSATIPLMSMELIRMCTYISKIVKPTESKNHK